MKNYLKTILFLFVASVVLVSCSDDDDDPKVDPNEYSIDGATSAITATPFWVDGNPNHGTVDHIRFVEPVNKTALSDLFKITPISGTNPLEGTYTYSDSGDVGTYNLTLTHNWDGGFGYDWTTNGASGSVLEIELIKDEPSTGNIYDITISKFTLDYGNWDFAAGTWVSEGTKELVFHYRGTIDL